MGFSASSPVLFLIFLWSIVCSALAASCRGDECCTGGSSSSSWSCLTFSGVWSGPAELGQALVWGMLLWPQLQPCVPSTGVWLWPQCLHAGTSLVPAEGASMGMGRAQYCLLSLSETHSTIPMPKCHIFVPPGACWFPAGSGNVAAAWAVPHSHLAREGCGELRALLGSAVLTPGN